jgi:hypothetical protein
VRNLRVKDAVTVHLELAHEGTRVLAEVMEYLDDVSILQNGLQPEGERINLSDVKDVAVNPKAYLLKMSDDQNVSSRVSLLPG